MNVEELLQKKGIYYITKERDYIIRCLNPEHEDKNPSSRVDKITGVFNCFSCGFKGNLFSLFEEERNRLTEKVYNILKNIRTIQSENKGIPIPEGAIPFAKPYRGISARTFRQFEAFTHGTFLPDRVIFPIRDITGKIVVFQGRHLFTDNKRDKYLNEPSGVKLPVYPALIRPIQGTMIIVEGIFDMLNLHDKGLTNAVAIFGVSTLLKDWKSRLENFRLQGVTKIFIMLDGDTAGREATAKLKNTISEMFIVEEIELGDGLDPGSLSQENVIALKNQLYGNT